MQLYINMRYNSALKGLLLCKSISIQHSMSITLAHNF